MADIEERRSVRLPHLDNLRTVLVGWVIGGHALLGYSAIGGWAYDEINEVTFAPVTELVLAAILGPSGLFVIGVFFFVAGLLTEQSVDRHGWRRYASDRVVRLGLPWLVSALLVWPASVWLAALAAGRDVTFWYVLTHRDPLLDSGSLWFALVLMLFSLVFALSRALVPDRRPRTRPLDVAGLTAAVVLIAVTSFAVRLWFPARSGQVGDLHLWQWPQCAGMFALGVAAARSGWLGHVPDALRRTCRRVTLSTLALLPVLALTAGIRDVSRDAAPYLGDWRWEALAFAGIEAVLVVAGSVWLVGLAERALSAGGAHATRWARGAFGAFVIQGPVLMAVASAGRLLDAPAEIKAPLVAALSITLCFWIGGHLTSLVSASGTVPRRGGGPSLPEQATTR
ncbi:acyltransferase [Pseudonocardia zijingensis]|uniref:acyltransferase family protein n=1 Tax=Pseudonocardia zijingensis TaxID=153376 RepID=UPI0031D04C71